MNALQLLYESVKKGVLLLRQKKKKEKASL